MQILSKKIKILLHYNYFNQGYAMLNYIKYVIAFFGLASRDVFWTMIMALGYAVLSYIIGWGWYKFNFADASAEISNMYNPLAKELRDHMNHRKN